MDKDEIIEMARQAGFEGCAELTWEGVICTEELLAFAKLVSAKATDKANARSNTSWTLMCKKMVEDEREACAKVCDDQANSAYWEGADACAYRIRARGSSEAATSMTLKELK
jgi:hypothetical protein